MTRLNANAATPGATNRLRKPGRSRPNNALVMVIAPLLFWQVSAWVEVKRQTKREAMRNPDFEDELNLPPFNNPLFHLYSPTHKKEVNKPVYYLQMTLSSRNVVLSLSSRNVLIWRKTEAGLPWVFWLARKSFSRFFA